MHEDINQLVERLLKEHVGGHKFFTAVDEAVREPYFFSKLFCEAVKASTSRSRDEFSFIVTGQFGLAFNNYFQSVFNNPPRIFIVRGGLKHKEITDLPELDYSALEFVPNLILLDDTLYAGVTMNIIKENVEKRGGKLTHSCFCYDGCKEKLPNTTSLYRYYDHHRKE